MKCLVYAIYVVHKQFYNDDDTMTDYNEENMEANKKAGKRSYPV